MAATRFNLLAAALALLFAFGIYSAKAQSCPFSQDEINSADFSGVSICNFDTASTQNCNNCVCAFGTALQPLIDARPGELIDCSNPGAFQQFLDSCQQLFLPQLTRALGVSIFQLPGLAFTQCPQDGPAADCIVQYYLQYCPESSALIQTLKGAN